MIMADLAVWLLGVSVITMAYCTGYVMGHRSGWLQGYRAGKNRK